MLSTLKFSSAVAPAAVGASLPLAAGHVGDGFQPLLPKATAAKTTAQEKKISCWILLLLSPAAVGASLPLAAGHAGEESRRR